MDFNEYQKQAFTTALYLEKIKEKHLEMPPDIQKLFGVLYCGLGLGESGEIQGKIKKIIRDSGGEITEQHIEMLKGELGDLLWYVAGMCTELGLNMSDVAEANLEKLFSRKERGKIRGSGDNR